jgi:hypothetical protein
MNRTISSVTLALLLVISLSGCSKFREDFKRGFEQGYVRSLQSNKSFHESFRKAFKQNFLASCEHGSTDPRWISYCTCADTENEKHFDDSGLTAIGNGTATAEQRADFQKILVACRSKAFKPNP